MIDKAWIEMSAEEQAAYFREVVEKFPIGCRVRVLESDVDEYEGATGVVEDHDEGDSDALPLVCVKFDEPVMADPLEHGRKKVKGDAFYD